MGLNFGNKGLFPTRFEELWKGVFSDRKDEVASAGSSVSSQSNIPNANTDITNSSVTVLVKPDQRVVVMACGVAETDEENDFITLRVVRGSTLVDACLILMHGTAGDDNPSRAIPIMFLDDPGEGIHTYKLQGRATRGNGRIYNMSLVVYTIGVS